MRSMHPCTSCAGFDCFQLVFQVGSKEKDKNYQQTLAEKMSINRDPCTHTLIII